MVEPRTQPLAGAFALLARLTRKGSCLIASGEMYSVAYPGERLTSSLRGRENRTFGLAEVRVAIDHGWLQEDANGVLRLTEAGALALRRGGTDAAAVRTQAPDPPMAPAETVRSVAGNRRAAAGSPLSRLASSRDGQGKPHMSPAQVEAAERLAADFLRGQMMPRVTVNWSRAALGTPGDRHFGPSMVDVSEQAAAAQERVRRALRQVGPEFADLLVDVCCLEVGLEAVERQRGWPPRTARVVLGLALESLVRHFGIVASGPTRGHLSRWTGPIP